MRTILLCVGLLISVFLAGCGKIGITEHEKEQRGNAQFSQALNAEKSGNVSEAIRLYKQVMIDEPTAYSAHFMLATLLQDHAEDYIGAIYHYKRYVELEPESEKCQLAEERIKICEQLLAPKILKKVGDTATGVSEAHLLKEAARLNKIIASLEGDKSELNEEVQKNSEMIKQLSAENAQLRKIVEKMRSEGSVNSPDESLRDKVQAAARNSEKVSSTGFSREELAALRREASDLKTEKSGTTVKKPVVEVPSVQSVLQKVQNRLTGPSDDAKKNSENDKEARKAAEDGDLSEFSLFKTPEKEETKDTSANKQLYVVQPGDTLMRIASRFYGDTSKWKRIRDANRGQIGPDGRVRAGQNIVIP